MPCSPKPVARRPIHCGARSLSGHGHDDHDESERVRWDEAPASMVAPLLIAASGVLFVGLYNREIVTVIEQTLNTYALVGGGG